MSRNECGSGSRRLQSPLRWQRWATGWGGGCRKYTAAADDDDDDDDDDTLLNCFVFIELNKMKM
jgi:hypothetical protein